GPKLIGLDLEALGKFADGAEGGRRVQGFGSQRRRFAQESVLRGSFGRRRGREEFRTEGLLCRTAGLGRLVILLVILLTAFLGVGQRSGIRNLRRFRLLRRNGTDGGEEE